MFPEQGAPMGGSHAPQQGSTHK